MDQDKVSGPLNDIICKIINTDRQAYRNDSSPPSVMDTVVTDKQSWTSKLIEKI